MKTTVQQELEQIAQTHGGLLRAEDVLEFARDKKTALHKRFEWDNTEAAKQYRIWQARQLICLYVAPADTEKGAVKVRRFVSLSVDRKNPGGGYRTLAEVVNNKELYQQMLMDALDELQRIENKYQRIRELRPVFETAKKIRAKADSKEETAPLAKHA